MARKTAHTRIGIREIAEKAGVSMMTASRAIRGVEGVSERKRAEILRIAKRLNYVPNSNARSLSVENSNLVGISLPTFANDVFAGVLAGMRGTFEGAGYASVIDTTEYNPEAENRWVDRLLTWRPAGVILTGTDHLPVVRQKLRDAGIPTLEIWDVTDDPIDICVGINHWQAGFAIGEHLVELGYRKPAYVGTPIGRDARADARLRGMEDAFSKLGGVVPVPRSERHEAHAFGAGFEGTKALLAEGQPDTIFFLNDHMAFGGLMACGTLGLSVPEDIGLVGFNALDLTTVLPVPLTTASTPRRQIGIIGARNLLARIHGVHPKRVEALKITLISGATTRPQG
ncbi:MAG: LacI family DNA-binding transcriptional regulator [Pseudomonadota bacterium]